MLVDSHCHLDFEDFAGDQAHVVMRAHENGIGVMQTICTHISKFPQVLEVAETYDHVYASVGIHPHHVDEEHTTTEELVRLAAHPKVIGIGETGLDYYYDNSPRDKQAESFRIHIAAARETGCPLIVHTRDADEDTIAILREEMEKGAFPFLIHCFTATRRLADVSIALGGYISLSGILTFKNAKDIQETAKDLPLERILVETDSPFLAPIPHRGERNEPAFTRHTAEFLAGLKGIGYDEVANVTTDNFFRLFAKAKPVEK